MALSQEESGGTENNGLDPETVNGAQERENYTNNDRVGVEAPPEPEEPKDPPVRIRAPFLAVPPEETFSFMVPGAARTYSMFTGTAHVLRSA